MSPTEQPDIDPALADAVRRAYVRPIDESTARRHVSAMVAATASAGTAPAARLARPRRRLWRPVLAAGAATLLAPVGLAAAGVALPDVVEEPYRAVGIELPRQERDARRAPTPAVAPVAPRTRATPPAPVEAPRKAVPRRPAGERPRSARPGKRPVNRGRRSAPARPQRARPTGTARPNASAGPTHTRSKPKPKRP